MCHRYWRCRGLEGKVESISTVIPRQAQKSAFPKQKQVLPRTLISIGWHPLSSIIPWTSVKVTWSPLSKPWRASSRHVTTPGLSWRISRQRALVSKYELHTSTAGSTLKKNNASTNLCDHRYHGTQRLLSIGIIHYHVLTKVTEELATKQNTWTLQQHSGL